MIAHIRVYLLFVKDKDFLFVEDEVEGWSLREGLGLEVRRFLGTILAPIPGTGFSDIKHLIKVRQSNSN